MFSHLDESDNILSLIRQQIVVQFSSTFVPYELMSLIA